MIQTQFSTTLGDDKILLKGIPATINASNGNDTFIVENSMLRNFIIDGGAGVDSLQFNKSGIFTALTLSNIEQIDLADGVTVTFTSSQLEMAMESLAVRDINPGLHFHGVAGGKEEIVRVTVEYKPYTFVPDAAIQDAISYSRAVFELDNAQTSDLFHNVTNYNDFYMGSLPKESDDDDDNEANADNDDSPLTDDAKVFAEYKNRKSASNTDRDDDSNEEDDDDDFDEFVVITESDDDDDTESDDDDDTESDDDDDTDSDDEDNEISEENDVATFARADGSANDDYVLGSIGVDYATLRFGNDTYFGHEGNDLLVGHQGADLLSGGTGNDIFLITSFGDAVGAAGKNDDNGNSEWIDGDRIVGGAGIDTLRITGGAAEKTTLKLSDDNFQGMEIVEIGATVGRLNIEDTALQLLHNHYYLDTNSKIVDLHAEQTANNVKVDASDITKKGLTFIGNANINTFIGTQKDDIFIGNAGNDLLTGGNGEDKFVFGAIARQTITGNETTVQHYEEVENDLTGVDTITDFKRGTDKIVFKTNMFTVFAQDQSVSTSNLIIGTQAKDTNDYLIFNPTSKMLSYDVDGNGKSAAVDIVILTGVTTLTFNDFVLE